MAPGNYKYAAPTELPDTCLRQSYGKASRQYVKEQ
jgi:hypothetical protein